MTRLRRIFGPALLLAAALVALFIALAYGGGADPYALGDPGPLVRWGLPIAKLLVNISAALMLGSLVMALWVFSADRPEYGTSLDVAAGAAAVLTVSAALTTLLIFLDVSGQALTFDEMFGASLGLFLTDIELGRAWLTTTLIAATVTVLAFAVRNQTAVFFVSVLAALTLLPLAQQGHASGTAGHNDAVSSLGLHMLFAGVWLGGLITIVIIQRTFDRARLARALMRYSTVALVCFIVVVLSGYVSAALRIGSLPQLATPYGALVMVKVTALLMLGVLGAYQRRRLIGRISLSIPRAFGVLVTTELAFMGIASGVAAALARTATPVSELTAQDIAQRTPAEILTGEPLPPEPNLARYFTEWHLDIIWVLVCGFGVFFYLAGYARLRKRGDHWPIYRPILWVLGMAVLFYLTSGGVAVYEQYLFSAHMLGHMGLTMAVPILLVPAAPVTLALRAIDTRTDGSRGSREWILIAVHSRYGRFITNPVVAAIVFAGSLWVFYYTPILRWAMVDHLGHEFMIVHFLISGYLFVQSLIGIDPVPYRFPYPMRLVVLLATMTVHAFFGVSLMSGQGLLAADWFGAMGWGTDALVDQQVGGGVAWSIGEIPILALALTIAVQWSRADTRESIRRDRHAERTGEAELNDYNAQLARLAERDATR